MVQCFDPTCNHTSESHTCRYFCFPSRKSKKKEYNRWKNLIRRKDKIPQEKHRVCSCHFKDGMRKNGPTIFERNKHKLFASDGEPPKKRQKPKTAKPPPSVAEMVEAYKAEKEKKQKEDQAKETITTTEIILQAELDSVKNDLKLQEEEALYKRDRYSACSLSAEALRMETGLPTKEVFKIVVDYVSKYKDAIVYYAGWKVDIITFEDQIFITLMKLRQNYTNLHLAQLFDCSVGTISNIVTTFIHVLHSLLFNDIMTSIPSRQKNSLCAPSSFTQFNSCRIVIDCTDVEIATPKLMSLQNATYSSNRGMNSFKLIVGVAPNAVITYVSKLFPGAISDKGGHTIFCYSCQKGRPQVHKLNLLDYETFISS